MSRETVRRRSRRDVLVAIGLGVAIAGSATATAAGQELDVVTDGLANPRGMTFGPDGRLYVAEAGKGGTGACVPTPEGGQQCYGATGAITRVNVRSGRSRQIVDRLPSLAIQESESGDTAPGSDATGPHDVSFNERGRAFFTVGLGADPAVRSTLGPAGRRFAALYRIGRRGRTSRVVDLGAYEASRNPDAGQPSAEVDSNPFSVDATIGRRILVTDAGGNDLLRVGPDRSVTTVAVFPFGEALAPPFLGLPPGTKIPYQPVPTGVVRVPGGAYVGQLTGFPFPVGAANVFRVTGVGAPTVRESGFTNIVDIALGEDRTLYVLQITSAGFLGGPSPGKLIKVSRGGTKTELAAGKLTQPAGLTLSEDGDDVYVSNKGGSPTDGEIVRVPTDD